MRLLRGLFASAVIAVAGLTGPSVSMSVAQVASPTVEAKRDLAAEVSEIVKKEMERLKIVGLGVALGRGGEIVFAGGFGLADRDAGTPVSDATMFRWASISKPLTAVAALQLAREGKLDLDADVRDYVPEFPEKPQRITTRQLLGHQGGIVHYSNGPVIKTSRTYEQEHPFKDVVLALDMFKESPLVCKPGSKYSYTTHGYILAGAAVERAAMQPFAAVVQERIAKPLKLTTLRPDYQWEAIPQRSKGYKRTKSGEIVNSTDTDVSWKLAGGGWISCTPDLARFGLGMLGDRVVDAETRERLWTEQKTADGKATGYGYGFSVLKREGGMEYGHSGAQEKAATLLMIWPDAIAVPSGSPKQGIVVALMCNTEDTDLRPLGAELARLLTEAAKAP